MALKIDAKLERKVTCAFKNDEEFAKYAQAEINEQQI